MPTLDVLIGPSVADGRDISVKQTQFKQTDVFCAPSEGLDILQNMNIYDAKGVHLGSKEVTRIYQGTRVFSYMHSPMTVSRAERSAETFSRMPMASSVDGGLSIRRTLRADVAPPDDFR